MKHASVSGPIAVLLLALLPAAAEARQSGDRLSHEISPSLQEAVIESAYSVTQGGVGCEWEADNPAQGMHGAFMADGIRLTGNEKDHGPWSLDLSLEAWGRGEALRPLEPGEPEVLGQRVEYRRGPITEWYLNEERGLEQGFTVEQSPAGEGPLSIVLSIGGGLSAEILPSGRDARFKDRRAGIVLHYTGLRAWDAAGRELEASLVAADEQLSIRVEDGEAVYPLQIDPWIATEEAKLIASDEAPGDHFGMSVSLSGDTALVGAPSDHYGPSLWTEGSAYVFVRSGTTWTEQAKLIPSDAESSEFFGYSASLWGDTAVVGAFWDDPGSYREAGSAYVFVRNGTSWTEQAKLTLNNPQNDDHFGDSVSLEGDTLVIGVPGDDIPGVVDAGSAIVFVRSGTSWSIQAKLNASDAQPGDSFGDSVGISGDMAVVGTSGDDHSGFTNPGSAYVFVRSGTTWTEQAKLVASDVGTGGSFGAAASLSGDTALIGESRDDHAGGTDAGSAYVFVRSGTTWTEQAKLVAGDAESADYFGIAVSLSGDRALVGAWMDDLDAPDAGSAYVFVRSGTSWTEQAKLTASDAAADDYFGFTVSLSDDTALVGAHFDDHEVGEDAGSAYVIRLWPPPATYCTAGTSASGCQAALSASGTASATAPSGFVLMATDVEGAKDGLFYFGTSGKQANPWGTSYQCVVPPVVRAGLLAGSGLSGQCDGSFSQDLNAFWCPTCPKPQKNPGVGAFVQAQLWYRDPLNTSHQTTSLSDAIEFFVAP